ncbi:hypothetical protein AXK11_01330 [Cephaloticoccus primus]|uniref:AMP-dependent synthetase/ligase domain-containing protein n=1 Tax=Cephaloticoccus primus TaxID=1548207 RepID=A0A139SUI9_9BACT|nr:hypothetical protein AXK11_01330 [Cephaloticoccus primus]
MPRGRRGDGREGRIDYLTLSFAQLEAEVDAWCARLCGGTRAASQWRGVRTLVMLRQGLPLIAVVFALFKLGAVPIVIDPGMGLKNFLRCVARSRPKALVGIPLAQWLGRLFFRKFRSVEWRVWASGSLTHQLSRSANKAASRAGDFSGATGNPAAPTAFPAVTVSADELAAILFTSGSTGSPKGVCYTHGIFEAQLRLIREHYGIAAGEVDLPMLPIFALFNPALGMTTVVPEIDPRRPAQVDPAKIVQAILQERVSNSFGSPTLWLKIKRHCLARGIQLPSLRRILCAGAPVPAELWEDNARWLPNGQIHSPYGATEALPVCSISAGELAEQFCPLRPADAPTDARPSGVRRTGRSETAPGKTACARWGACVGRPLPGIGVKIIEIVDGPIATLAEVRELPRGEVGEIVVSGPVVTECYDGLPEATARAKVFDLPNETGRSLTPSPDLLSGDLAEQSPPPGTDGRLADVRPSEARPVNRSATAQDNRCCVAHRMGDAGYLDEAGFLWFCGRVVERVQTPGGTLYTEPCEQVFRSHPQVERCALIGLGEPGAQVPALVVQPREAGATAEAGASEYSRADLARELRELALAHEHTRGIERFYFHPSFPVDVRHNAKIHRHTLARWASQSRVARVYIPQET